MTDTPATTNSTDTELAMRDDLRERREETWERLYVKDEPYGEVCDDLAAKYGVSRSAIEKDIGRMDDWLPKLSAATGSAYTRLRELERNQKRRRELLRELRAEREKPEDESDYSRDEELRLLDQLDRAATLYVDVAQSVGAIEREPQKHVTKHEGTVNHELTDQQRSQLDQLRQQARENIPERDDVITIDGEVVNDAPEDGIEGEDQTDG